MDFAVIASRLQSSAHSCLASTLQQQTNHQQPSHCADLCNICAFCVSACVAEFAHQGDEQRSLHAKGKWPAAAEAMLNSPSFAPLAEINSPLLQVSAAAGILQVHQCCLPCMLSQHAVELQC